MVTGRATVAMVNVVLAAAAPGVTGVGVNVGVVAVTIEGEIVCPGVMGAL